MKTVYPFLVVTRAKWLLLGLVLAVVLWFPPQDATAGQAPVNLGSATSFAVLANSTITCSGDGTINGDVGLSAGSSITGIPPVIVNGTQHVDDAIAVQAQADLATAYNDAVGRTGATLHIGELGGAVLLPGLYKSSPEASFAVTTGNLTLDAQGNPNAVWIFQMTATITVGTAEAGRQVILKNGAQARNIFWQVGSSATLYPNSVFKG
ncbi:MAG TPA: ice-binding family protein, partial [Desulfobaccales bacterium]